LTWRVDTSTGPAAEFHARPLPDPIERALWVFEVERPALVLGSTQPDEVVDHQAARAAGVEVVRRRSGGGAVLLVPGEVLWVDVLLPHDDPLWLDDVGRAAHWIGAAWAHTLADAGVADTDVHTGAMVCRPWSGLVCFGGLGPGEVTSTPAGPKIVGISQRRTRNGVRFQCAVVRQWDAMGILELLALSSSDRETAAEALADAAVGIGDALDGLMSHLVDRLPD